MNVDTLLIDLPTAPWQLPAFTDLGVHQLAPARLLALVQPEKAAGMAL